MPFLQKEHFRWKEPKELLALQDQVEQTNVRPWARWLIALVLAAMFMASWYEARLSPQREPPPLEYALPLALGLGWFIAFVYPRIELFLGTTVHLYDTFLARRRQKSQLKIRYAHIASFSWVVRDDFAILVLHRTEAAGEVLLGVPPKISQQAVTKFMLDHQVPHKELT